MARPNAETVKELRALIDRAGTLRKAALSIGLPPSYAAIFSNLLKERDGMVSKEKENEIRHRLNLFPLGTEHIYNVPIRKLGDLIRWRNTV